MRQIEVNAAVYIADETSVSRHTAAESRKRPSKSRLTERSRHGPSERSRNAGQRLANVDVAPNRLAIPSRGKSTPRVAARLDNPRPCLVARNVHIPSHRLELLETGRDRGELCDLFLSQRGRI